MRVRKESFSAGFKEYVYNNCGNNGKQRSNITKDQRMGLDSVMKKVSSQEVIICKSDKTGKLIPVSPQTYAAMGEIHTKKDRVISEWETHVIQKELNNHTSAWLRMLQAGENWGHGKIYRGTCLNNTASVPTLSLLIKDHKPVEPGELPKTRLVVGSQAGMNLHLNNLISEVLEPLANRVEGNIEVISSEDLSSA